MQVKFNSVRVTRICGVFIRPGINHVDDDMLSLFKKDREFQHGLKTGKFEILGQKATVIDNDVELVTSGPTPGPDMTVRDLLPLIEHMTDPAVLDELEVADERATVQAAITKQRKRIAPPPIDEDKAKGAGMSTEEIEKIASEN